jgi:hypothetical protein
MKHFLFFLVLFVIFLVYLEDYKTMEAFVPLLPGDYPTKPILNEYPAIGSNETSDKSYFDIWWKYPTFELGSFAQITNNLKYYRNPDNGKCVRADMCNAMYKDHFLHTNIIDPLPPAEQGEGARVGYFRTEPNKLFFSIPTNENILY